MKLSTQRTDALLDGILDRDGYLDGSNAPQLWTSLARNLEIELQRLENVLKHKEEELRKLRNNH